MKHIAYITQPRSAHRGIGFYTQRLFTHLQPLATTNNIEITQVTTNHELRATSYDLIHYTYFDLFYHTLPTFLAKPTIVSVLDAIPLEFPAIYRPGRRFINLQLQKFSLSQARFITTLSHASVNAIHQHLGVPHSKLKLIYLAADPMFTHVSKPKTSFNLPKKFVMYVGGVNYNKNLPTLVNACKQLHVPLIIVGKEALNIDSQDLSHPELRHLKSIDWSGVTRVGYVSDEELISLYNLATVYVQPAYAEGFGLPVLEAMACGTPTIVSNTHSLPEVAGSAAVYFDPYSTSDLVSKLQLVLTDSKLQSQLAKLGPLQAAKFSWDTTAKHYLDLYSSI